VCDCCFGEQLDNKKPFRPLYIFKHMLKWPACVSNVRVIELSEKWGYYDG
jgi:hypothetical protein